MDLHIYNPVEQYYSLFILVYNIRKAWSWQNTILNLILVLRKNFKLVLILDGISKKSAYIKAWVSVRYLGLKSQIGPSQ